jgi:hypothetical protein
MTNLTYNGYTWSYSYKGIHTFTKKENGKFAIIQCEEKQLTNGDIEFMTEHGLTLDPKIVKKIHLRFDKSKKPS